MRLKKNINLGIIRRSNTKFSELTLKELYGWEKGELTIGSGSERVKENVFMTQSMSFITTSSEWATHSFIVSLEV